MANKAISELPQAQNVNNQDLFVLEQSGIAKKLPAETFITEQGIIDALAEALDGHGGIQAVTLSSVSGRIRTYRITFTDQSATTFQVYDGTSIDRISRTSSSGLDDVYTIFLSDGTTTFFTVHNGADGTVSEAMLNDALKDKAPAITETTESSAIANFSDGADNMVMHHVIAEINPVQSGSGDPSPDNIRLISGWTGCNVTRTGKNLCSTTIGRYLWASGARYPNNGKYCAFEDKVAVKGGEQIAVSFTDAGTCSGVYFAFFNGETYISQSIKWGAPWTVSVPDNANMVALSFLNNVDYTTSPVISNVMLTYGSTASEYEPYQGTSLAIDWTTEAGTVYGGTIDVATGLLTVDRAINVIDGSQEISGNGVQAYGGIQILYTPTPAKAPADTQATQNLNLLSDKFSTAIAYPDAPFHATGRATNSNIYFNMPESVTTAALARAWFADNNTQIVYKLAIPQTYQLTPQEVKTLLGTNNVWADTGDTSVTYAADTKMFIEPTQLLQDNNLAYVESSSSASRAYAVNDLFVNRDGLLCKVTATVSSGGTLVEGTNYTILSGNGGLGAEVTSVLNGKEDVGWLTGMGFSRTDVNGGGAVTVKDYTIFLTKLITVSGANIQSLVNAHYKVTFYLRNSNGGSFSLSGNCAGNTYNLASDSSGLVSGTFEGDVSANGTIYNGSVGGSVGSGSIFAATVLVKF